ncbi:MAG: hypothetical protein KC547_21850 [Anaerolineae bacterium]|nr:hypothetical protein [Anaerolineae bacterium]
MAIQSDWLVPNTVILTRYSGAPTEEEILNNSDETIALIDSSDAPFVHVIVDSAEVTKSPPLSVTVKTAKASPRHQRAGWILTVGGQNALVQFATSIARQLLQVRTQNFDTIDDAIAYLKTVDETIDWSQIRTELIRS